MRSKQRTLWSLTHFNLNENTIPGAIYDEIKNDICSLFLQSHFFPVICEWNKFRQTAGCSLLCWIWDQVAQGVFGQRTPASCGSPRLCRRVTSRSICLWRSPQQRDFIHLLCKTDEGEPPQTLWPGYFAGPKHKLSQNICNVDFPLTNSLGHEQLWLRYTLWHLNKCHLITMHYVGGIKYSLHRKKWVTSLK